MESDTDMEEEYYDDYGGDFSINSNPKGGGNGKKGEKKKGKTKGSAENIYNSKHIRVSIMKTENSKSKRTE